MRKIIYIRHGEDTRYEHKYDEILTDEGKGNVKKLTKKLVEEHGVPDIIYYSPYYRTRQTKRIMAKTILKNYGSKPETIYDKRLSRFFTKKQSRDPDIKKETIKRGAPIYETLEEFKNRIDAQLEDLEKQDDKKVIWCVTHTLILAHIVKVKGIHHGYSFPYLDSIILTK